MKGWQVTSYIHPSKRVITLDVPEPVPGPSEVLVDVYSAALNFFDILQSQGKYQSQPPFPFILGAELAGRISENSPIPKGCPFKPGDRVFGGRQGAYVEKAKVNWHELRLIPNGMSYDQAAGFSIAYPTSYAALLVRAKLTKNEWVLVHAAAGGVGLCAVQIAKAVGAKVIATAGSKDKLHIAKTLGGADEVLNYSEPGWQKEVLRITGGKGADVIYDPVGLIRDSLKCIAWNGRALVVGFAGGAIEKLPLNLVLLKNISIVGVHWGAYEKNEPEAIPGVWEGLLDLFATRKLVPVIYHKIFRLEELPQGLGALEKRQTYGKVILRVRDETETQAKL